MWNPPLNHGHMFVRLVVCRDICNIHSNMITMPNFRYRTDVTYRSTWRWLGIACISSTRCCRRLYVKFQKCIQVLSDYVHMYFNAFVYSLIYGSYICVMKTYFSHWYFIWRIFCLSRQHFQLWNEELLHSIYFLYSRYVDIWCCLLSDHFIRHLRSRTTKQTLNSVITS